MFNYVYQTLENIFILNGYEKIETPIIEFTELFSRSIGTYTDIVQKEMFTFQDRKGRSITLRPEGTPGVVRAYLDNNFSFHPGISKFFYYGPMFRAENPQKGRLREFHQFGCESIGSINPLLDAELITMNMEFLQLLKLKDVLLEINSVGCKKCRVLYIEKLKKFLKDNYQKLCENCKIRAEQNPLRVFDCKNEQCQKIYENAEYLTDNLCDECKEHFEKVKYYLGLKNIKFSINKKLVRGFDYYSKTVFEIKSNLLGSQNAILGGGRYDYLVELLGGNPTPAVGAAVGIERIIIALLEQNLELPALLLKKVYIGVAGQVDEKYIIQVFDILHKHGYQTNYAYENKSLKAQLKEADKLDCEFCIILGETEIKNNNIIIRYLKQGKQEEIAFDKFKIQIDDILKTN